MKTQVSKKIHLFVRVWFLDCEFNKAPFHPADSGMRCTGALHFYINIQWKTHKIAKYE